MDTHIPYRHWTEHHAPHLAGLVQNKWPSLRAHVDDSEVVIETSKVTGRLSLRYPDPTGAYRVDAHVSSASAIMGRLDDVAHGVQEYANLVEALRLLSDRTETFLVHLPGTCPCSCSGKGCRICHGKGRI